MPARRIRWWRGLLRRRGSARLALRCRASNSANACSCQVACGHRHSGKPANRMCSIQRSNRAGRCILSPTSCDVREWNRRASFSGKPQALPLPPAPFPGKRGSPQAFGVRQSGFWTFFASPSARPRNRSFPRAPSPCPNGTSQGGKDRCPWPARSDRSLRRFGRQTAAGPYC